MWLDKITDGVLQVMTPTGPRYVQPSFRERLRLIWMFRNFSMLSPQVLSPRQQHMLSQLCSEQRFASPNGDFDQDRLIGTLFSSVLPPSRSSPERRIQPRSAGLFEVRYGIGKDLASGEGCDLGGGGIGFTGPRSYPLGAEIDLHYRMDPTAKWMATRVLIRHSDGNRMGAAFMEPQATRKPRR